jgi:hypothetical protein
MATKKSKAKSADTVAELVAKGVADMKKAGAPEAVVKAGEAKVKELEAKAKALQAETRKGKKEASAKEIANSGGIIFANPDNLRPLDRIKRRKGFRPLILFKPILRKRLLAKGVKLRDDKDVVELGYKFKKHIQDNKPYILIEDRFLTPKQNFIDDAVSVAKDFTPIIKQIVQGIINFFKKVKEREAKGQATPTEKEELKELQSEENEARTAKELEAEEKEEKMSKFFNFYTIGFAIAFLIVAYVALKPKKAKE